MAETRVVDVLLRRLRTRLPFAEARPDIAAREIVLDVLHLGRVLYIAKLPELQTIRRK